MNGSENLKSQVKIRKERQKDQGGEDVAFALGAPWAARPEQSPGEVVVRPKEFF